MKAAFALALMTLSLTSVLAFADDNTKSDMPTPVKKMGRSVKDSTCTMVKGKMECAADKAKHKAENVGDDVKDTVKDDKK